MLMGKINLVSYLSIAKIEARICGEKTIDVERLRKHTTYAGCEPESNIVKMFWRVFEGFTQE